MRVQAASVASPSAVGTATVTIVPLPDPPVISAVTPASGRAGTAVAVTLTGANFTTGSTVMLSGSGVGAGGVTFVSHTKITATFTIAPTAAIGTRSVTVTTVGGTSAPQSFTVTSSVPVPPPSR